MSDYTIPEANRAIIIRTEKKTVWLGNDTYSETWREVERCTINTDRASSALAWARTYGMPWQGFIVMLDGKVIAMETPADTNAERARLEAARMAVIPA